MSAEKAIEADRNGAEISHGDACTEKTRKPLEEFSIPKGLLPVDEIEDLGFDRSTGLLWLKLTKKTEHKFEKIGQTAIYLTEITGFIEHKRLSKVTGVKARELLVHVVVCEVLVGLSKARPVSAFQLEDWESGGK